MQIYFDTRTFKAITKDEKATFLNQKAVIGEFTGLFLGLSFICFVEIFYFLILGLVRTLGKRVVKKQPVNEEDEQNENEHQEKVNVSIFVQRLRSKPWTYKSKVFLFFFCFFLFCIQFSRRFIG